MTITRQLALEDRTSLFKWQTARDAVREALAQPAQEQEQPVQEPVAYMSPNKDEFCTVEDAGTYIPKTWIALYTTPQQRPWVGLTAGEIHDIEGYKETREIYRFARAIEAKLKDKNT